MSPDQFSPDQLEEAQARLRRQQEQLSSAAADAEAETTTYEAAGGQIRVTVSGRGRIEELYVSERMLRSEGAEPELVQAVNHALAAAAAAQAERISAGLDLQTANAVAAAGEAATELRAAAELREGGAR